MSRIEILNSGGLRADARRALELRSLAVQMSPDAPTGADQVSTSSEALASSGSARVQQGLTSVHAAVHGPREAANRANTLHAKAVLEVDVTLEPWSGRERRKRAKGDRRVAELAASIKSTFEPVIHTHLYPRSEIAIYITVENQDGGVLSCAINAVTLALIDAGVPLSDSVLSLTLGYHLSPSAFLLDVTQAEETSLPTLTLAVLARSGKVTLAQSEDRLQHDALSQMIKVGVQASQVLHAELDEVTRERTQKLVNAMGGKGVVAQAEEDEHRGMVDATLEDSEMAL